MELKLVPKGAEEPLDRIDLETVRYVNKRKSVKQSMKNVIPRLYGQIFTSRDMTHIMMMDKDHKWRTNLNMTVRANLVDMAKDGDTVEIVNLGCPGRASTYREIGYEEV